MPTTQVSAFVITAALLVPVFLASAFKNFNVSYVVWSRRNWKPADGTRSDSKTAPSYSKLRIWFHKLCLTGVPQLTALTGMGLSEMIQLTIFVGTNLIFVVVPTPFVQSEVYGMLNIGRRAAWVGTGLGFFILLTATRNSILETVTGIPFDRMVMYHRWSGYVLYLHMALHSVTELQNWDRQGTMWQQITNTKRLLNLYGTLSFLFMVVFVAFSHSLFRRRFFNLFYYCHFAFVGYTVFGGLHWDEYALFSAAGMLFYFFDRIIRFVRSRQSCTVVSLKHFSSANMVRVVLRAPRFSYHAGQYAFINVTGLSLLAWHPFSMTSAPDPLGRSEEEYVTLHIKNVGDWSKKLVESVQEAGKDAAKTVRMSIDGGHGRPALDFTTFPVALFVSGGVGVTPMLAVLQSLIKRAECGLPTSNKKLYFFWYIRISSTLPAFAEELSAVQDAAGRLRGVLDVVMRVFVTADDEGEWRRSLVKEDEMKGGVVRTPYELLEEGKPEVGKLFSEVKAAHPSDDVAVGVCGPQSMVNDTRSAAAANSDRSGLFSVHWESFEL
ncbi:hypothetical protein M427DRAFT_47179 [Gonapodya prolifera JEL478]|uniref:FAD-binding FR-type domain-containing protein n=1 Tax=Gonapodya prolifera (strain JEL478) TaxID=1344416 RepID=A0A139A3U1_GONPJ|nr:hypothetical protein M427DRAFT_47179 [Gonapodya prolifera JEL478]|eukprot:KXS11487.1 hypothetical protein M427DRAFT_47179 [Gonapodya prolifera JEL478]